MTAIEMKEDATFYRPPQIHAIRPMEASSGGKPGVDETPPKSPTSLVVASVAPESSNMTDAGTLPACGGRRVPGKPSFHPRAVAG